MASRLQDVIQRDTRANQPLATAVSAGTLYFVTDELVLERSSGSAWQTYGNGDGGGRLIGVQRKTATGAYTYTPTSGTAEIIVECQGAGGGGGGVASPTAGNAAIASAGGGGGWLRVRITSFTLFNGATGSVGALGAGGVAGNNAGTAGGNTTFIDTALTTYTAGGGGGGAGQGAAAGAPPSYRQANSNAGLSVNGDDLQNGWFGSMAFAASLNSALGGWGGHSKYGRGGSQTTVGPNASQAGGNATGKGGGGGAAIALGTGLAAAGGNGSDGIVIIWEYS